MERKGPYIKGKPSHAEDKNSYLIYQEREKAVDATAVRAKNKGKTKARERIRRK